MSKVDAQRAMREARFAAYRAKLAATTSGPAAASPVTATTTPPSEPPGAPAAEPAVEPPAEPAVEPVGGPALCGHRGMGEKSCRRPAGHAEKTHRYT